MITEIQAAGIHSQFPAHFAVYLLRLYQAFASIGALIPVLGAFAGVFPLAVAPASIALGLIVLSGSRARQTFENPREFIPAVRALVSSYMIATTLFTLGVTWG